MSKLIAGIVFVVVIGWAPPAGANPPNACTKALDAAEKMRSDFSDYATATADFTDAQSSVLRNASNLTDAVRASASAIRGYTATIEPVSKALVRDRRAYDKAARACRRS